MAFSAGGAAFAACATSGSLRPVRLEAPRRWRPSMPRGRSRGPAQDRSLGAARRLRPTVARRRCHASRRTRSVHAATRPLPARARSAPPTRPSRPSAERHRVRRPATSRWAAASARPDRRDSSGVNAVARSRNAAAAAKPPRACARAAERSSSAATSSSGVAAACARCHAWRSGSISRSVASASAR